ncbi:rhodanese-like domain-containing protein [Thalassotalea atypica]|uniref:rhodanese-like domain-containing protein n=1 Tax=Thalassotalea atypica TaxID=2054316 RepID=UPI0025739AA9|nr:rhodanese-like domain-containing protein [Thalassotalea atypica]
MKTHSNVLAVTPENCDTAHQYFAKKLSVETDCSDVYTDICDGNNDFILLDVRSVEAFEKSHAITALNMPHATINEQNFDQFEKTDVFIVYCWGPGCNGATKAASKISALGFAVKEMIGGIHYWEDFERYPVVRREKEPLV